MDNFVKKGFVQWAMHNITDFWCIYKTAGVESGITQSQLPIVSLYVRWKLNINKLIEYFMKELKLIQFEMFRKRE